MGKTLFWALRDMRGAARHFWIVLLCLILSLVAITAVHVTGKSVLKSIEQNGRAILGGDWVIRQLYSPAPPAARQWLEARQAKTIETVEINGMLSNPANFDSSLVEIKAVNGDYPLFGTAAIETGSGLGRPFHSGLAGDGLILDRALAERLGVGLGDAVRLGGKIFRVAAWLVNEPDRAGSRRFGLAPRVFISIDNLKTTGLMEPGSMIYYDLRVEWPQGLNLKKQEAAFRAAFPGSDWRLTDTSRASPQTQRFVDNLIQFLTLIGLSSLLIGGIGIANGMRAYLETRLTTIAVFKSIGMKKSSILAIYFWQIAAIGLAGSAIGLVIGAGIPFLAAPLLESFLPFPVKITIDFFSLAVPLSFGLLTTLIFSLWPLGETEKTSPLILFRNTAASADEKPSKSILAAIGFFIGVLSCVVIVTSSNELFSAYFLGGAFICFLFFFVLGSFVARLARRYAGAFPLAARTALQNLGRRKNTAAQTLVSLGIGLTVLVSIALIDRNLRSALDDNLPKDAPAFFFLDIQGSQKERFETLVAGLPTAQKFIILPNLRGRLVAVNGIPAKDALIDKREAWLLSNERGFTYTSKLPASSALIAGKWWPENYKGPPLVSVVDDVQRGFGVKPGDKLTVSILGRTIEATIANVREVNWTSFTVNFAMTFAPGVLEGAPHSWLATVVADPSQENTIQRAVTREFPNISMVRISDAVKTVSDLFGQMNQAVRVMAFLTLVTGLLVLTESLAASRQQRSYDTVILKVIGVPRRTLSKILLIEFALLGIVSSAIAAVLGTAISWAILVKWMDLPWSFYPDVIGVTILSSLAVIVGTGWLVLRRLLSERSVSFLRNE